MTKLCILLSSLVLNRLSKNLRIPAEIINAMALDREISTIVGLVWITIFCENETKALHKMIQFSFVASDAKIWVMSEVLKSPPNLFAAAANPYLQQNISKGIKF